MPERRRKRTNQDRGTDEVKQDRSLLLYVLLSFVTFSVYHFYFMDLWAKDVNILCEKDGKHTVGVEKMMLFSVLTFGVFYENFQDGTWNDADGIIDAGCAYICEWDDPTDKISQGDSFTDQQLRIIAKDLGVPDDLNVEIRQSPKAYWESAGLWDIYVEITHNGKLVASGSFDVETGEMGRNIYIYTPV